MHLLTQRLKLSTAPLVPAASLTLDFFRGVPMRVECAAFTASDIASLAGVSSVTMMLKKGRTDKDSAALMAKTVAAADFTSATAAQWVAGTHEQFAFDFTAAECNLDLGSEERKTFWLVFKALLSSDSSTVVLGCGFATCYEANHDPAGDPPENPGSALSLAEADARFVRFDGEQLLTEEQQLQAQENLGITGGGVTDHGALTGLADDDHPQYLNNARGDARYAALAHTHAQSDVSGLVAALAGKASSTHTHAQSDITGLVSDLAGKASSTHTHAQSDITGLTSALAAKADLSGGTVPTSQLPTTTLAKGGTGATTAAGARVNLLPGLTGNAGKLLGVNSGGTDVEWKNPTSGATISTPYAVYVEGNGNDATGELGNPAKPFLTGTAAFNAGQATSHPFAMHFGVGDFTISSAVGSGYCRAIIGRGGQVISTDVTRVFFEAYGTSGDNNNGGDGGLVELQAFQVHLVVTAAGGSVSVDDYNTYAAGAGGQVIVSGCATVSADVQGGGQGNVTAGNVNGGNGGIIRLSGALSVGSFGLNGTGGLGTSSYGTNGTLEADGVDFRPGGSATGFSSITLGRCSYIGLSITNDKGGNASY